MEELAKETNNLHKEATLNTIREARPFVRSFLAVAIYLRHGGDKSVNQSYAKADEFLERMEDDVRGQ